MESSQRKGPPLEEGLLQAMQALDRQIEKEIQRRRPDQRAQWGVQKWEAYSERIELVAAYLLGLLGEGQVKLDSLLVLSEAFTRTFQLFVEELDRDGLGELRTSYSQAALENIRSSAERALGFLGQESRLL